MASFTWIGSSGDWGTAAYWSGGLPNDPQAMVTISGSTALGVTIAAGEAFLADALDITDAAASLTVAGSLDLAGASATLTATGAAVSIASTGVVSLDGLSLSNGAGVTIAPGGRLDLDGSSGIAASGPANIDNSGDVEGNAALASIDIAANFASTGTLGVSFGAIDLQGTTDSLAGLVDGTGTLIASDTLLDLASGLSLAVAGLALDSNTISLAGGLSYAGDFSLGSTSVLSLGGNSVTLDGPAVLTGTIEGPGTVALSSATLAGAYLPLIVGGGAVLLDNGMVSDPYNITLGGSGAIGTGATIVVAPGATFDLNTDAVIAQGTGGEFDNAGLLEKTDPDSFGVSSSAALPYIDYTGLDVPLTNTGTVLAAGGGLAVAAAMTNDGLVEDDATFGVTGALSGTGTIDIGANAVAYLGSSVATGQSIVFQGSSAALEIGLTPEVFGSDSLTGFNGTITGMTIGDTIEFASAIADGFSYANGQLTLTQSAGETSPVTVDVLNMPGLDPAMLSLQDLGGANYGGDLGVVYGYTGLSDPDASKAPFNEETWTATGTADFSVAADWTGTIDDSTVHFVPASNTYIFLAAGGTYTITVDSAETIDGLEGGGAGTTLDVTGGSLVDLAANAGYEYSGYALIGAGAFDAVEGFTFAGGLDVAAGATLTDDAATLTVTGTTNFLAGTIDGGGLLYLDQATATLAATAALNIASVLLYASTLTLQSSLSYGGTFVEANATTLELDGNNATFTGIADLGNVAGPGTLTLTGSADGGPDLSGTVVFLDAGMLAADNVLQIGITGTDAAAMTIEAGATLNLLSGADVWSAGAASFVNDGLIEQTGATNAQIEATLDSTGTLAVAVGTLHLEDGATLDGAVTGAGSLELDGGLLQLAAGASLSVAGLSVQDASTLALAGDQTFAGDFAMSLSTLNLAGNNLALSGPASLGGDVEGSGTLSLSGQSQYIDLSVTGGATLVDSGTLAEAGYMVIGTNAADSAALTIAPSGVLALLGDDNLRNFTTGTISNAGLIEKLSDTGTSTIISALANTGSIAVDRGTLTIQGSLTNDGAVSVASGAGLIVTGGIAGSGTFTVDPGVVAFDAAMAATQTIDLVGGGNTIVLGDATQFSATIESAPGGEIIDFAGISPGSITSQGFVGNDYTLDGSFGSITLHFATAPTGPTTIVGGDGYGGTDIAIACFAMGTRLLTARGEVPVESLRVGDLVPTLAGAAARRVRWIGQTRVDLARHPQPGKVAPVRIEAHAFGPGTPHRDLILSPDHAVMMDGALVPIHLLVNGASIARRPAAGSVRYFHVELDAHDVLLAEGLPVESYLDTGNRGVFADGGPVRPLHPDFCAGLSARTWSERGCAALLLGGTPVDQAHRRLLNRAQELGHRLTDEPALRVIADGMELPTQRAAPATFRVRLPAGVREVRLLSRSTVPEELDRQSDDRRRLGLAVAALRRGGKPLPLSGETFAAGFHPVERGASNPARAWRWTNGEGVLRLQPSSRASVLELRLIRGWVRYHAGAEPMPDRRATA